MSTATQTQQLPAVITGKFNIALTQSKFQQLADKASKLIFNEDNLEEIKQFLTDVRKVEKAIEETHKDGKAEALKIGRDWDAGKNMFLETVAAIKESPQNEYARICTDVQTRQRNEELETHRKQNIKTGIEGNAIRFAKDISECTTSVQLTNVERIINLEKTRKDKYMEFLEEAVGRYNELNSLLKTQKETVRELEENARQQAEAKKQNDDARLLELQAQQEVVEAKVEVAKTVVQEAAINQSMKEEIPVARTIFPSVSARRSIWTWEVADIKETAKKMPDWTTITPIDEKIDEYLKAKKAEGINVEEFTVAGIRFFLKKTF